MKVLRAIIFLYGTFKNSGGTFTNTNENYPVEIRGGRYWHARNGGNLPKAVWSSLGSAVSICEVTGITSTALSAGLDQNFRHFIWNNPGQTVVQPLHGNMRAENDLYLTAGIITTGENYYVRAGAGSIYGTSGYINGNLRLYIPSGAGTSAIFPVGDAARYAPVSLTFNGTVSGDGYIDVYTVPEMPPAASGISQEKYINRRWRITNTGVNYSSYNAGFTFSSLDKTGNPATGNLILRKLTGGSWSGTNGTAVDTVMTATGLTSFGDFVIGESACSSSYSIWFGSTNTDWNTGSNWCSGTVPDASADVLIPGGIANYPVIGAGNGTCKNLAIESGAVLTLSGSATLDVKGNWNNSGTFISNNGTVSFTGTIAQTINGETGFYNLTINNTAGVQAGSDIILNGILNLESANPNATEGSLHTGENTLRMLISTSTVTGTGDVTGRVKRAHTFTANVPYRFGNQNPSITF